MRHSSGIRITQDLKFSNLAHGIVEFNRSFGGAEPDSFLLHAGSLFGLQLEFRLTKLSYASELELSVFELYNATRRENTVRGMLVACQSGSVLSAVCSNFMHCFVWA